MIVVMTAFILLRLFKSQPIAKGTSSFISFILYELITAAQQIQYLHILGLYHLCLFA